MRTVIEYKCIWRTIDDDDHDYNDGDDDNGADDDDGYDAYNATTVMEYKCRWRDGVQGNKTTINDCHDPVF